MFECFSKIIIRIPSLPIKKIEHLDAKDTVFTDGLYLASREFHAQLVKHDQLNENKKEKQLLALHKYWIRNCMRCVPFGTFAGVAIADVADRTSLKINGKDNFVSLRIDMNCFQIIVDMVKADPKIRPRLRYYPNNTLHRTEIDYRYIEYEVNNGFRTYTLTSIETTEYLDKTLAYIKDGLTYSELLTILCAEINMTPSHVSIFIDELISSQILISELEPNITGLNPLDDLIYKLIAIDENLDQIKPLQRIRKLINCQNKNLTIYKEIETELNQLLPSNQKIYDLIQADLFLSTSEFIIDKKIVNSITKQLNQLLILSRNASNGDLRKFIEKFSDKYELSQVPLLDALDPDIGIGYAGITTDSINEGSHIKTIHKLNSDVHNLSDFLTKLAYKKYSDFSIKREQYIEISEKDLEIIQLETTNTQYPFPNSMYVIGTLMQNEELLAGENFSFFLKACSGPSGANLIGRFAVNENDFTLFAREILSAEEETDPDSIYAEIVHLPESRVGNILVRSNLRKYEIPFLGNSGVSTAFQIPVSDLYISIRHGEVILTSKKLKKRVIPRLTSAHNFKLRSLSVYKFLCDLQVQKTAAPVIWDWGELLNLKYLPRVVYKNIIIVRARWRIEKREVTSDIRSLSIYCKTLSVPNHVISIEGEDELFLNLENEVHLRIMQKQIEKNGFVHLEEFLTEERNCIVQDLSGSLYTNELVIPIKRKNETPKQEQFNVNIVSLNNNNRYFLPESEWLYIKIYGGTRILDKILTTEIHEFVSKGLNSKWFEKFFFIRYKDNNPHLRIRFYNSNKNKQRTLVSTLMELLNRLVVGGVLRNISIDTYARELERYGPHTIDEAESIFFYDSIAVLKYLTINSSTQSEDDRLMFGLLGVDTLLNNFGLSLLNKKKLISHFKDNFVSEFGGIKILKENLDKKYRIHHDSIHRVLDNREITTQTNKFFEILENRSAQFHPLIEVISSKVKNDKQAIESLVASFIHMFINRLFASQARKYELVIYYYLSKYYISRIAREKNNDNHNHN